MDTANWAIPLVNKDTGESEGFLNWSSFINLVKAETSAASINNATQPKQEEV